jgi:hypothetical protein
VVPDFDDVRYRSYRIGRYAAFTFTDWVIRQKEITDKRAVLVDGEEYLAEWCRMRAAASRREEHTLYADAMISGVHVCIEDTLRQSG